MVKNPLNSTSSVIWLICAVLAFVAIFVPEEFSTPLIIGVGILGLAPAVFNLD